MCLISSLVDNNHSPSPKIVHQSIKPPQSPPNNPQLIPTIHGTPKGHTDRYEVIVVVASCRSEVEISASRYTCVGETFFSPTPHPFLDWWVHPQPKINKSPAQRCIRHRMQK